MKLPQIISSLICIFGLMLSNCSDHPDSTIEEVNIVFYNVENLFDIYDDPLTSDGDFTPEGKLEWTKERYDKKCENIAKVLLGIKKEGPDIIGLCEIENRKVLEDLIETNALSKFDYQIVHDDGLDPRGIDVAFLYKKSALDYESHIRYEVNFPWNEDIKSRAILEVQGKINQQDFHFFVNHWPSRRKGAKASMKKRMQSSLVLKSAIVNILKKNQNANIIVLGDFNDLPQNKSIKTIIQEVKLEDKSHALKNLMKGFNDKNTGTCVYENKWFLFDQIWVSNNLLNVKQGPSIVKNRAFIYQPKDILYTDKHGNKYPNKTYGGDRYYGGFSDHLPVYTTLKFKP